MNRIICLFLFALGPFLGGCATSLTSSEAGPGSVSDAERHKAAFSVKLPWYEFIAESPNTKVCATLVFEVRDVDQRVSDMSYHTVFLANAVVVESDLKKLRNGTVFVGCFDRWYSIFTAPSQHPLKVGDRVRVRVTSTDEYTICGFLDGR